MFTGSENHDIPLSEAAEMTARYRATMNESSRKGGFFGVKKLREILDQPDCVGIRYYYGLDENNQQVLVLTGVKANEDDIVDGVIAEAAIPCPNQCGNNNLLNS
jgi:hypothetical protein